MPSLAQPFELFVFVAIVAALIAVAIDVLTTVLAMRQPWPSVVGEVRYMNRGLLNPVAVEMRGPVVVTEEERLAA